MRGWPANWGFGRSTVVSSRSLTWTGTRWASKTTSRAQPAGFGSHMLESIRGKAPRLPHPAAEAAGSVGPASTGGTLLGLLMLLAKQTYDACSLKSPERSCTPPSSSLHWSISPYAQMGASRAGLDMGIPLGWTERVNTSPGTLWRPQKVQLHPDAREDLCSSLWRIISPCTSTQVLPNPWGPASFWTSQISSLPTFLRYVKNIYFPGF